MKRAIIIAIAIISTMSFCYAAKSSDVPVAQKGIMDLTAWDFEKNGPVPLDGEWEVYLNKFLNPGDFKSGADLKPAYIRFPASNGDFKKLDPSIKNAYATIRLRIKLKDSDKKLGLKTYIMLSSYKVFVNGEFKAEVGKVGKNKKESLPYYMNTQVYFQKSSDEVEIIYHTSDFHLNDFSIRSPLFGLDTQIEKQTSYSLGKDMFLFGSLFIMGIYHFGLFAKRRKDKASLYFGLLCLFISFRTIVTGERFLEQVLVLPYEAYSKIAYISAFMALPAFINFLDKTIDKMLSDKVVKATNCVGVVLALATLPTPKRIYDVFLNPYFAFMAVVLLYAFIKLLAAFFRKTPYAGLVLVGFLAIGITAVNDMIYQNALTNIGSIVPIGVFLFIFSQSYLLASKFSKAFNEAEELTAENQRIMSELKELNADLERKVEERTEELALEVEEHKRAEKEISAAYDKIELMSRIDYLTNLSNRRDVFEQVQKERQHAAPKVHSIVICDIDHFKIINDTYGHNVGDKMLTKVAELLRRAVGPDDVVARWGGEEFLMLLKNTDSRKAYAVVEKLRKDIENMSILEDNNRINITMTFGIHQFDGSASFDSCIAKADEALYEGKKSGRNKVVVYN